MKEVKLQGGTFLSFDRFELDSGKESNMVLLLGPNQTGKTQILKLLYTATYILSNEEIKKEKNEDNINLDLSFKMNKVYQINPALNFLMNNSKCQVEIDGILFDKENFGKVDGKKSYETLFSITRTDDYTRIKKPVFISPNGFGDYYRGIFALKTNYDKTIISDALTDIVNDLFASALESDTEKGHRFEEELAFIKEKTGATFQVQGMRIVAKENNDEFGIEKVASGLKTFAPIYLAMLHGLLHDSLIVDEPEVSLHPEWITVMAELLYRISKKGVKVFVATHSPYFIDQINVFLNRDKEFQADVWKFEKADNGNIVYNLKFEEKEIPPAEYLKVYHRIVEELRSAEV